MTTRATRVRARFARSVTPNGPARRTSEIGAPPAPSWNTSASPQISTPRGRGGLGAGAGSSARARLPASHQHAATSATSAAASDAARPIRSRTSSRPDAAHAAITLGEQSTLG
ncbi:MAG: hypothetical protein IT374_21595 [Polyangiaceae bacterium]|nr:hypothetical protein [Polyangiaceae bacterium]